VDSDQCTVQNESPIDKDNTEPFPGGFYPLLYAELVTPSLPPLPTHVYFNFKWKHYIKIIGYYAGEVIMVSFVV